MSLFVPIKHWNHVTIANTLTGANIGNAKDLIIKEKNQRLLWGHTVVGSSNGTTGALDGVDRWPNAAAIPDSVFWPWFVMRNGAGAQDLISYEQHGQPNWTRVHSPGGLFTGGSASTLPTATDGSGQLFTVSLLFGNGIEGGTNPQFVANMSCSDDLTCFRSSYWIAGNNFMALWIDDVEDPTSGWATPRYALGDKLNNNILTNQHIGWFNNYAINNETTGLGMFKGRGPHGAMKMVATAEGGGTGTFQALSATCYRTKNKISNTYRMPGSTPGLYEPIANADGGYHGRVFDAWYVAQSNNAGSPFPAGSTTPLDGSKQFVIDGDIARPWSGVYRTT